MNTVVFRVDGAGPYAEVVRSKLPFSSLEHGTVWVRSPLKPEVDLNEHLVWLWGMLKHERRVLKSAVVAGAKLTCECKVSKGAVRLLPNSAEMLHLLGAELILNTK